MPAPTIRPVRRSTTSVGGIGSLFLLLAAASGDAVEAGFTSPGWQESGRLERRALGLINDARREAGLPAVRSLPELDSMARRYSTVMATGGFVGHHSTDPDRRTTGKRFAAGGIDDAEYGENVGRFGTSREGATWIDMLTELSARLLASDAHRPRILGRTYTHAGTGVSFGLAPADADSSLLVPSLYLTQVFIARRVDIRFIAARAEEATLRVELAGSLPGRGRPVLRLGQAGGSSRSVRVKNRRGVFSASFRLPMAGGRARLDLEVHDGGTRLPGRRWIIDPLHGDHAIISALEEE